MGGAFERLAAWVRVAARAPRPATARGPLYATVAVVYAATWLALWGSAPAGRFAVVAGAFALFVLAQALGERMPARRMWAVRGLLGAQVLLVVAVNWLVPGYVTMVLLFIPTVRGFLTLPVREASGWALALAGLVALQHGLGFDNQHSLTMALVYSAGFAFFGAVIAAWRHTEVARERSDHLLRELSAAHAQLSAAHEQLREQAAQAAAQVQERSTLLAVSRSVTSRLEMAPLMGTILDELKRVVDYSAVSVRVLEGSDLVMLAYRGSDEPGHWARGRAPLKESPAVEEVVRRRGPLIIGDFQTDEPALLDAFRRSHPVIAALRGQMRAWLGVPLLVRDEVIGAIVLSHGQPGHYTAHHAELAQAFANHAAVAVDNARLYAQAQQAAARELRRAEELEALYRADAQLYRHLQLDQVLQALVDVAVELLRAAKSAVFVWDAAHERLVPGACRGFRPETMARLAFAPGEGVTGLVAATGEPAVIEDTLRDPRVARWVIEREGIRSLLQVPIKIGAEVFGTFCVNYGTARAITADDQRRLLALAQRAALAIANARLYGQAQQAATLEERQRLARELHDAVTQTLFSASLIAEVLPRLWERDPAEGRRRVEELRQLTRGALAEMRTLLLELRPAALVDTPLRDLLRQLGEAVTGRARIPVSLHVDGAAPHVRANRSGREDGVLPPDVQVALYRIAQEAVHNVVKHAGATRCELHLHQHPGAVELRVEDDGAGFEPGAASAEHLGLRIMRERAEAVGASLQIESRQGTDAHGTTVTAVWQVPRRQPRRARQQRSTRHGDNSAVLRDAQGLQGSERVHA